MTLLAARDERVLDAGGWFRPEPRATHVVDLMPWETRGARLNLDPLPGERFSRNTWYQADFLKPDLRLPFDDKWFDVALCGHTIEDLADPRPLLAELSRVAVRGVIECPSRLSEQTVGVRDRQTTAPGHPHHHWIVDVVGDRLVLSSKTDSALTDRSATVPLTVYEAQCAEIAGAGIVQLHWAGTLRYEIHEGAQCAADARAFVRQLRIGRVERVRDALLRSARRARSALKGHVVEDYSWWTTIVDSSRPYSSIELR